MPDAAAVPHEVNDTAPLGRAADPSNALSLRQEIYERLREMIFRGELPPGTKLSAHELAQRFEVSTMPVREALRALGKDGLVEVVPRKWTRVAAPDPELLSEIYPLVAMLERFAVATAPAVPLESVARAKQANQELAAAAAEHDVVGCLRADAQFHSVLIELSQNNTLKETIASLKGRTYLLESAYYRVDDASTSIKQHAEIIEALVHNDLVKASETVAANWEMGHARLRRALTERGTS